MQSWHMSYMMLLHMQSLHMFYNLRHTLHLYMFDIQMQHFDMCYILLLHTNLLRKIYIRMLRFHTLLLHTLRFHTLYMKVHRIYRLDMIRMMLRRILVYCSIYIHTLMRMYMFCFLVHIYYSEPTLVLYIGLSTMLHSLVLHPTHNHYIDI